MNFWYWWANYLSFLYLWHRVCTTRWFSPHSCSSYFLIFVICCIFIIVLVIVDSKEKWSGHSDWKILERCFYLIGYNEIQNYCNLGMIQDMENWNLFSLFLRTKNFHQVNISKDDISWTNSYKYLDNWWQLKCKRIRDTHK